MNVKEQFICTASIRWCEGLLCGEVKATMKEAYDSYRQAEDDADTEEKAEFDELKFFKIEEIKAELKTEVVKREVVTVKARSRA
jgi:hypothetical protein